MTAGGIIITTKKKLTGISIPEKIPKALIGMIGLNTFAKRATAVVLLVTVMALTPLLKLYAILLLVSALGNRIRLCFHASTNTNMSSAAIPITKKIAIT